MAVAVAMVPSLHSSRANSLEPSKPRHHRLAATITTTRRADIVGTCFVGFVADDTPGVIEASEHIHYLNTFLT